MPRTDYLRMTVHTKLWPPHFKGLAAGTPAWGDCTYVQKNQGYTDSCNWLHAEQISPLEYSKVSLSENTYVNGVDVDVGVDVRVTCL